MTYLGPLLPTLACLLLLLLAENLFPLAWVNAIAQLLLFVSVVLIPTWRTGRMSYVDIGWPLGLAVIGAVVLLRGEGDAVRVGAIGVVYLFMGLRMGLMAVYLWSRGHLEQELPRYEYQRVRWERRGIANIPLIMQSEALSQGTANMSFLALPAFLIATNPSPGIHALEFAGLLIWLLAFGMETLADAQKNAFLREARAKQLSKPVCDVGLWRYSRHPNYFAEWLVWNALIVGAVPSWIALGQREPFVVWLLLGLGTLFVSRIMYTVLVHYTGAKPAEYYSLRKRPAYREYQERTNLFFPGPRKGTA